jgi:hypothetical protein
MYDINTLIELLVLFQIVDTGVNDDPPDPAFQ